MPKRPPTVFDRFDKAIEAERKKLADIRRLVKPDTIPIVEGIERWAADALKAAKSLNLQEGVTAISLGRASVELSPGGWRKLAASPFVAPYLQVQVAEEAGRRAKLAETRVLEVLDVLVALKLQPIAQDYLDRVAALYLWGFDKETFALARATLDAALFDQLGSRGGDREVKRRLGYPPDRWVDLRGRIEVAGPEHLSLLDRPTYNLAHDIRADGNDVLHKLAPHHLKHATTRDAIQSLGQVLKQLLTS